MNTERGPRLRGQGAMPIADRLSSRNGHGHRDLAAFRDAKEYMMDGSSNASVHAPRLVTTLTSERFVENLVS